MAINNNPLPRNTIKSPKNTIKSNANSDDDSVLNEEIKNNQKVLDKEKKLNDKLKLKSEKAEKSAKEKAKKDSVDFSEKYQKFYQTIGIVSLVIAVFLTFICISFLINWFNNISETLDAKQSFLSILTQESNDIKNIGGRLGAYFSNIFIKRGFGIGFFFIIIWLYSVGLQFSFKYKLFPVFSGLAVSSVIMVWLSLLMGFLFKNTKFSILGGISGFEMTNYLEGLVGKMGVILILALVFILFLILIYNFSLMTIRNKVEILKNKVAKKSKSENADDSNRENIDTFNKTENSGLSYSDDKDEDGFEIVNSLKDQNSVKNGLKNDINPDSITVEVEERVNQKIIPEKEKVEVVNTVFDVEIANKPAKPEIVVSNSPNLEIEKKELENKNQEYILKEEQRGNINTPYDPRLDLSTYKFPTADLLKDYGTGSIVVNKEELEENKNKIVTTLGNYGIKIDKIRATIGPTVTLYEIVPAPGVRISKIKNLEDDIALSIAALGIRIIAPVPGKGTIGIEVPNQKPDIVSLKSVINSEAFVNSKFQLPVALGKTIANEDFIIDLAKMPHVLMAGATGQGKSVGLNVMIASLLFHKHPAELKFVLVDPKKVELPLFAKIERHYLAKLPNTEEAIITDTTKVIHTLKSLNIEMDSRYDLLQDAQVRDIKSYNEKFISRKLNPNDGHRFMPYIVVVIDEFADLILTAGKEVEYPITRLAQLARAIGIHLIIATQRPSVNIITGIIKANFPARLAFRVISKVDSRTILDTSGADQLIGRGDMLFSQGGDMIRLQCAFIDTPEIEKLTEWVGEQRGYSSAMALPEYVDENEDNNSSSPMDINDRDELFEDAARLIVITQQGSTSMLQRKLKLGYNRAGRIIDQLENAGIVGPYEGSKAREVKIANEMALEQFLKDLYDKD